MGTHRLLSFKPTLLEPSRLSLSPPHDYSWYWRRGTLNVQRGSAPVTKVTPTPSSANGAPPPPTPPPESSVLNSLTRVSVPPSET